MEDCKRNLTREQLFEVSAKLFQEKGFKSASMEDIAQALGIRKSSIYYYIKSKEELLREISVRTMNMLLDAAQKIVSDISDPKERIEALIDSHVRLLGENLDLFTCTLRELTPTNAGPFWEEVVDLRDRYEGLIRWAIRDAKDKGVLKEIDEKMVGFALLGMINWMVRWYSPDGERSCGEIAQIWTDIFLNGAIRREKDNGV